MTTVTLDFNTLTPASPYVIGSAPDLLAGYVLPGASDPAQITNLSGFDQFSRNSGSVNAIWYYSMSLPGTVIEASCKLGTTNGSAVGVGFADASGNGWMMISSDGTSNCRIFLMLAWQLSGGALLTISQAHTLDNVISLRRNTSSGEMSIYVNGVQIGTPGSNTYTSTTYSPRYGCVISRGGRVKEFSVIYTAAQAVTSINGGDDIEQGETGIPAILSGFTGAVTSIPTNQTGITTSNIAGATNAPTFSISGWAEGQPYPILPVATQFTFTRSGESAAGTETVTYPSGWAKVTFSAPVIDDSNFIGKWIADQGHTVDGGAYYNQTYGDLVVGADSGVEVTNGGTFPSWFRPATGATAGNMYFFQVTVTDGGAVVVVTSGLKGESIKASAIRAKKIKSSKFF